MSKVESGMREVAKSGGEAHAEAGEGPGHDSQGSERS